MIVKDKPKEVISSDEVLDVLFKKIEAKKGVDLINAFNNDGAFKEIHREKQLGDYTGKGRAKWRRVARIHPVVYQAALRLYGPDVFKDKNSFKDLMKRPEMQAFLTVPITEL